MSNESLQRARIAELEADNKRLRRLLDQRDAPSELRHQLRGTIAMLRTIIRRSAVTERDRNAYVGHIEDRLDALIRAQTAAETTGWVELQTLLTDELLHYGISEGKRLVLAGPNVFLRPRAGQVMAMAIHELAVNAVEYGPLGIGSGHLDVAWSYQGALPDRQLTLTWTETESIHKDEPGAPGFGTEVLTRMLDYELEARSALSLSGTGLVYSVTFPLTDRIGWVGED